MRLDAELRATLEVQIPDAAKALTEDLPDQLIKESLKVAKVEGTRRRSLPADLVIWLVIGMALLRERCIRAVVSHLSLTADGAPVTNSAIVQARDRLGEQPMEALFGYTAEHWGLPSVQRDRCMGLQLFGADGSCLRVADTEENESYFSRPSGGPSGAEGGYPLARIVALMVLRTRIIYGAAIGPYTCHESVLAKKLWPQLPDESLVILDRGFVDFALFFDLANSGKEKHFLCRAKKNLSFKALEKFSEDDMLVELKISKAQRQSRPELPLTITVRAIRYQRKGFRPQMLLTSMLDSAKYPAEQIITLYHDRWELELGYDEIKTHTLEREESLRSKSPERTRQEFWGLLIAYNLVRRHIERFALDHNLNPLRVSYRATLLLVRNTCVCAATGVGSIKKLVDSMNEQMHLLILPERRAQNYKRAVKIRVSNYKKNPKRGSTRILN